MHPKRLGALLLGLALLAACGGGGGGDDDGGGSGGAATGGGEATGGGDLPDCPVDALEGVTAPVEITFWHAMNDVLETELTELTDAYNTSQDRVRVRLVNQTGYDENFNAYRTADDADRPNLVQLEETQLQAMIDSGTALPAQACVEAAGYPLDGLLPRVREYFTVEDVLWPMPFNISNPVLYYNQQVFQAAGLDPARPPRTLEELRSMSQQIVDSGAARFGLAIDTGPSSGGGWFIEQWFAKAGELYANEENGRAGRATEMLFDSPFGAELLTFVQDMAQDGLAVNVGRDATGRDNLLKLVDPAEPAAMTIETTAALSGVLGLAPQFPQVTVGVGPMPGPEGEGGVLVGGAALYIVDGKPDEQIAATWDFLTYLTAPETQAEWAAGTGYVPITTASVELEPLATTYAQQPFFRVAYDQLVQGASNPATAGAVLGPQRQIREVLAAGVERVLLEGADPAETLQRMKQEADQLLADYAEANG